MSAKGNKGPSVLDSHKMQYEDMAPRKLKTRKGGKGSKMSKNNKTEVASKAAPVKKNQKSRAEHAKDILIAVLITSAVAFISGMHFANQHQADINKAVSAATTAQATVKK